MQYPHHRFRSEYVDRGTIVCLDGPLPRPPARAELSSLGFVILVLISTRSSRRRIAEGIRYLALRAPSTSTHKPQTNIDSSSPAPPPLPPSPPASTRRLAAQQCAEARTELALAIARLSSRGALVSDTREASRRAFTCNRTLVLRLVDAELRCWRWRRRVARRVDPSAGTADEIKVRKIWLPRGHRLAPSSRGFVGVCTPPSCVGECVLCEDQVLLCLGVSRLAVFALPSYTACTPYHFEY